MIIELDGKWHYTHEHGEHDVIRQNTLKNMGFTILRYPNTELQYNFQEVCINIDRVTRKLKDKKDRQEHENGKL